MNAEFQWWLLILGIVIGGALVYLVLADVQGDRSGEEPDEPDEADETDVVVGARPAATPAATPPGDAGRASAADGSDVKGDRPEAETPIADAH